MQVIKSDCEIKSCNFLYIFLWCKEVFLQSLFSLIIVLLMNRFGGNWKRQATQKQRVNVCLYICSSLLIIYAVDCCIHSFILYEGQKLKWHDIFCQQTQPLSRSDMWQMWEDITRSDWYCVRFNTNVVYCVAVNVIRRPIMQQAHHYCDI